MNSVKVVLGVSTWSCVAVLAAACVTPAPTKPVVAPAQPLPEVAEGPTRPSPEVLRLIDRMAARVDMLQLARTDLVSFDGTVGRDERLQWIETMADFDAELKQFVVEHPELDATERARLERRVVGPLQVLKTSPLR